MWGERAVHLVRVVILLKIGRVSVNVWKGVEPTGSALVARGSSRELAEVGERLVMKSLARWTL